MMFYPTLVTLICCTGLLGAIVIASIYRFRYNYLGVYAACGVGMLFALGLAAQGGSVALFLLIFFTLIVLFRLDLNLLRPPVPQVIAPRISRHERLQQNGGSHTDAEWRALCAAVKHRCVSCRQKRPLTKDHIVPVIQGGTDNISNIQPLCRSCNSSKGTRTIDYRGRA